MADLILPDSRLADPRSFLPLSDYSGRIKLSIRSCLPQVDSVLYRGKDWAGQKNFISYAANAAFVKNRGVICKEGANGYGEVSADYPSGATPITVVCLYRPYKFDTATGENVLALGSAYEKSQITIVSEDNGVSMAWYGARTIALKNEINAGQMVCLVATVEATVNSLRMYINGKERSWSYEGGSNLTRTVSAAQPVVLGAGPATGYTSYGGPTDVDVHFVAIMNGIVPPVIAADMSLRPLAYFFKPL